MNIKIKLLLNTVAPTLLVALAILVFNTILFSDFVDEAMIDRVNTASNVAEHHLQDLKAKAVAASLSVAKDRNILRAIVRKDRETLLLQAAQMQEKAEVDFCTITDPEGRVIARLHAPDNYGDSVTTQATVQAAMAGKSLTAVERGSRVRLSVRSGTPILDDQGVIAGIVLVGYRLDTEHYVDVIKEISGCESTVYLDDERVSTTVLRDDGTRAIGTIVSARLSESVLAGNTYAGRIDILGRPAVVRCTPIHGPDGQVVGMMLAGRYINDATQLIMRFVQNGLLITLVLLALAVGAILVIVRRLVMPIHAMTRAASALAVGDIDIDVQVNTKDEMRILADAFTSMIESTRQQMRIIERIAGGDMTDSLRPRSENDQMNRTLMKLNETLRAQATNIRNRDVLLQTANQVADTLLRAEPDDFSSILYQCMGMMARAINADRMYLFRNHTENGNLYFTQLLEWAEDAQPFQDTSLTTNRVYREHFRETLLRGECFHSLIRDLPAADQEHFRAQGILSILLVPVFIHNEFWGVVGFDNCHSEQLFTENEESVMRSGCLLIVNALLRNEYMHSIRDTSAKLEIALADARAANNTKSNFLAHMSHEIRTPLNAVIGLSELALGEGSLSSEVESNLEKIYSAGSTILSIVNDILDISKIESGKFELHPVRYDTPSLINDTVTLNIVRIQEKPITFTLYVDENLPGELYGDDLRVKQIFNNLLSNAFKFTASGIVEWRLSFERDADSIWLVSSVRDTGQGITPENLQKLFTDYNQLNSKTNRGVEGTGLGLVITKYLTEMMDGTIHVESEYDKGSVFHVRLRQAASSSTPIGREVAGNLMDLRYTLARRSRYMKLTRVNLSYAHVLVVDDIETNLDVVKGMLKPYELKVDCAISGSQAVDMIRAENPRYSAVFMDHMMPGMNGVEATRIIREEIGTDYARNIPIIALTANAILGNEEMFLKNGFQAFISKPIDVMKLDSILRRWVRDKDREKMPSGVDGNAYPPGNETHDDGNENSLLDGITINGVDIYGALEFFGGNETVFIDVLRSYAVKVRPLLRSLPEYLKAENFTDYGIVIHGIKGSSYGIAAQWVGREAELLEHAVKAGSFDAVRAGHPAFAAIAETLIADIDAALGKIDAAVSKPNAPKPAPELLRELREACAAFDMDRTDAAMARMESFQYERGGEIVAWLREQIDMMNFENISRWKWPFE